MRRRCVTPNDGPYPSWLAVTHTAPSVVSRAHVTVVGRRPRPLSVTSDEFLSSTVTVDCAAVERCAARQLPPPAISAPQLTISRSWPQLISKLSVPAQAFPSNPLGGG